MKKLVLFDLDNTLFDSYSYRKQVFIGLAHKLADGYSKKSIIDACQKIYDDLIIKIGLFDPEQFLATLCRVIKKEDCISECKEILLSNKIVKNHLHSDVIETARRLTEIARIGIFSQGVESFQAIKITPLLNLLDQDKIHITENKKAQMQKIFQRYNEFKIFFVDDMLSMLYEAYKINPRIIAIWIKRGRYAAAQKQIGGYKPYATVETLRDIIPIVKTDMCDFSDDGM